MKLVALMTTAVLIFSFSHAMEAKGKGVTSVSAGTQSCIRGMLAKTVGASQERILTLARQHFDADYAASRAASRNRLNWKAMGGEQKAQYRKKVWGLVKSQIIPRLMSKRGIKITFVNEWVGGGVKHVRFSAGGNTVTLKMPVNGSCGFSDATAGGVSLSTLVADAFKH